MEKEMETAFIWKVPADRAGMKLGDYLRTEHGFSRRLLKAVKEGNFLSVNGKMEKSHFSLSEGDAVKLILPPEKNGEFMKAEDLPLNIVYEDESLIVVDKPAGMASIPSRNHASGTLANGLLGYYRKKGLASTVHILTRLDRDTSGLMLIAKHRYAHGLLAASQKAKDIRRIYIAAIEGRPRQTEGTIDLPIGRKEGSIIERAVTASGKRAITHYRTIAEDDAVTLVSVELETGRTHQIRVHFSEIGHPLAGDTLYGGSADLIARQALHSSYLSFIHPFTKEKLAFSSELPRDMKNLIHHNV